MKQKTGKVVEVLQGQTNKDKVVIVQDKKGQRFSKLRKVFSGKVGDEISLKGFTKTTLVILLLVATSCNKPLLL